MYRFLLGAVAVILLASGALFMWLGYDAAPQAAVSIKPPPDLPKNDAEDAGLPPPAVPTADARSREQKRFERYDRDRDGAVSRLEMMASRSAAFRRLDKDGNNLLTFEEWAAATGARFDRADADGNGRLTQAEFAATAPKRTASRRNNCACPRSGSAREE